jgi:hypothetical protein
MNRSVTIRKFIEHARQVLRRIEIYEMSDATDVPAPDLVWMKERLRSMMESAEQGTLPPVESRYPEMTRMIMD